MPDTTMEIRLEYVPLGPIEDIPDYIGMSGIRR